MIRACFLIYLGLSACTETIDLRQDDPLAGLVSLTVTPGVHTISITDLEDPPMTLAYAATGRFTDGSERDVTAMVAWRVDNPAPGTFRSAGNFETSQRAGGHVLVNAVAGPVTGTASLTVVVTLTVLDPTFPPPLGADTLFTPGTPIVTADPMRSPTILYPSDATMFPQGLARILFQHRLGQNNDALRLTFDSDVLHLTVLTSADRWQPDGPLWNLIAASHPGAQTTLTVAGASTTMPGTIYASRPARLSFARTNPGGVLYYWSAASNGVLRTTLGATTATRQYPPEGDATCVGCHTVSRNGASMAVSYGTSELLQSFDLRTLATTISETAKYPMGWAAFSPDGTLLLVADKGVLVLRGATTGMPVGTSDGRVPLSTKATHPDWSPDGTYVAVAISSDVSNMEIKNGAIARIRFSAGVFGEPEILVPSSPTSNNYFPKWSPDGKFIAYVSATTPSRGAPSAELRVIRVGGGPPAPLRLANHRVAGVDDIPDLANTMPTWGPPTGDVSWLAFSSTRPYGAIMPTAARRQVWMAGLDLTREGDPSFAAFWLPSQDVRVLNNNPIWSVAPSEPTQ